MLPNLVAHGFCVPALCELLDLDQAELLSMLHTRGLPATGFRVLPKSTSPRAWKLLEMQWLLVLWSANLFATCIAVHLGRTPGSVRYKAKALGLRPRDRATLTRIAPSLMPGLLPPTWRPWCWEDEKQIGEEHLRGVCSQATSIRIRRDFHSVECRAGDIELPARNFLRGRLKTEFNPAEPFLKEFRDWNFRKCILSTNWFWGPKGGSRISKKYKRTQAYQSLISGLGETTSHGY